MVRENFEIGIVLPRIDSIIDDIKHKILSPLSCVREFDSYWSVECDLPLVNKKDIKITFDQNILNIEAKLREKYTEKNLGEIKTFEFFKKSIKISGNINSKKTSARFLNGRLEIKIPKTLKGHSVGIS